MTIEMPIVIGIIKKTTFFVSIFDISLCVLLKFRSGEIVGCGIKFCIQRVPTRHTFDRPLYPKNKKYLKNGMMMMKNGMGTRWMQNLIPHPTSSPDRNLSKNTRRYVENTNKKVVFFFSSSKINKYYFIILTIILLVHFRRPILS